jgi:hypothetical protein
MQKFGHFWIRFEFCRGLKIKENITKISFLALCVVVYVAESVLVVVFHAFEAEFMATLMAISPRG